MSRTAPRGVPSWQTDDSTGDCFICHKSFSLFFRRHHCRKCGRVVCANCSSAQSTYLPTTYVVSPPTQIFLESPHVPHRTCDDCMQELDMIRAALRTAYGGSSSGRRFSRTRRMSDAPSSSGPSGDSSGRNRRATVATSSRQDAVGKTFDDSETLIQSISVELPDEDHRCPVCGRSVAELKDDEKEAHINDCLTKASFSGFRDSTRRNRMIIYQLPEEESANLGECVICFEDLSSGDTVGRLECLCVYHEKCILDWFGRKGAGSCPVHNQHD